MLDSTLAEDLGPQAADAADSTTPAEARDRVTQGLDLLLGERFTEFRGEIARLEAEVDDRLSGLERHSIAQSTVHDELADKGQAALQREYAEYKRRKNVEAELRERLARLRSSIEESAKESRERSDILVRKVDEQLMAFHGVLRAFEEKQQDNDLDDIRQQLDGLAIGKVDRTELADLLAASARRLSGD
jgi:hypothetical protein